MKKTTKLLFLLTFPENVRNQYVNGVKAAFPDVEVNAVDHHSKVGPYIAEAEALARGHTEQMSDILTGRLKAVISRAA